MPAVLIERKGDKAPSDHEHTNLTTEHYVNRPDIEFQRCADCGDKIYPPGFIRVGGGIPTTIMWPVPEATVLLEKEDIKGGVRAWLSRFLAG